MKRCLHLIALLTMAASLHGCSLWYFDHDYDAAQSARWDANKAATANTLAAR